MFGISLSGKSVAALLLAAVVIIFGWWAYSSYQSMEDKVTTAENTAKEAIAARDAVVKINADLNQEIIRALKDASDKELLNQKIAEDQDLVRGTLGDLKNELAAEIAKRKLAENQAGGTPTQCYDPRPKPPEVDITWKAYCSVSADPKCKEGSKSP